jgi:hypothetical protein
MKKIILYFTILCLIGCNKSEFLNDIDFQKYLISGSGNYHNTQHTWYLDSLVINNVPYKLTSKDKMFNKTFYNNGTYSDSDGYSGKWNISKVDELLISVKNNATGSYIETKSSIIDINSFKLSYTVTGVNNVKYDYYFKISYE